MTQINDKIEMLFERGMIERKKDVPLEGTERDTVTEEGETTEKNYVGVPINDENGHINTKKEHASNTFRIYDSETK